jgi:hypothetical protein
MGLPGMVFSAIAAVVGATMYWAVTYQGRYPSFDRGACLHDSRSIWFRCFGDYLCRLTGFGPCEQSPDMNRRVIDSAGNLDSVHEDSK